MTQKNKGEHLKVIDIEINKLVQEENSRSIYRNEDLQELMSSLSKDGLLHPVGVRSIDKGKYEILFGNRRFMAAKKLGWHDIPCTIIDLRSDEDADSLNLIENIKRSDITAYDEGRIYYKMKTLSNLTPQEICARMGIKVERVLNCLSLYTDNIPKEYRNRISSTVTGAAKHKGKMATEVAANIINISRQHKLSADEQKELFDSAFEKKMTIPQAREIAKLVKSGITIKKAFKQVDSIHVCTIHFSVPLKTKQALEKKYNRSFHKTVMSHLMKIPELGILGASNNYGLVSREQNIPVIRRSAAEK